MDLIPDELEENCYLLLNEETTSSYPALFFP